MFTLLFAFLALILATNARSSSILTSAPSLTCAPNCSLWMKCSPWTTSTTTPPIWALVDNECVVYKTSCLSQVHNCIRVSQCLSPIVVTTQQECQTKCPACDYLPEAPVCGWFPDIDAKGNRTEENITFQNDCKLRKFSCETGRANHYPQDGECPKPVVIASI